MISDAGPLAFADKSKSRAAAVAVVFGRVIGIAPFWADICESRIIRIDRLILARWLEILPWSLPLGLLDATGEALNSVRRIVAVVMQHASKSACLAVDASGQSGDAVNIV